MLNLKKSILLFIFTITMFFIKQNVYASETIIPNSNSIIDNNSSDDNQVYGYLKVLVLNDNNSPLKNVTFHVLNEDKDIIFVMTTNEFGIAISKKLDGGTYYYRESSLPLDVIPDTYEYPFRISEKNQVITKKIVNKLFKRSLILYALTSGYSPIENANYTILDENENIIDNISTDYTGVAISKELEPGKYYYLEDSIPHQLISDSTKHEFYITDTSDACEIRTLMKRYACGKLKITCVDENSSGVMGVTFNILDSSKNILDTITTDITGTAYSKNLNVGEYYYQEVSGPTNIVLDTREIKFLINKNEELVNEKIFTQVLDFNI